MKKNVLDRLRRTEGTLGVGRNHHRSGQDVNGQGVLGMGSVRLSRMQESVYQDALRMGVRELARILLPVGRYSRMQASANLLNWLKFLKLRMASNAQWEIQRYAEVVCEIAKDKFPRTMELFLNGK